MSYKSPIEVITEDVILQMEDDIVKAVQKYGINVNKIELQKALMYDRKQYTQGFEDGRKYEQEERGHGRWQDKGSLSCRCSECGCKNEKETPFCHNCGAKMDLKDHYCDRNKCLQMEYNGKGCAECKAEEWD